MSKASASKVKKELKDLLREIEKLKKAHAKLTKTLNGLEANPKTTLSTSDNSLYMKD